LLSHDDRTLPSLGGGAPAVAAAEQSITNRLPGLRRGIYFARERLCSSLEGRDVDLLTLTGADARLRRALALEELGLGLGHSKDIDRPVLAGAGPGLEELGLGLGHSKDIDRPVLAGAGPGLEAAASAQDKADYPGYAHGDDIAEPPRLPARHTSRLEDRVRRECPFSAKEPSVEM